MEPGCGLGEVWNQNASVAAVCVTPECKCRATCERSKVEVTTLDEQSPCEGLSSGRRHSHVYKSRYQQPIVVRCWRPSSRSPQHRVGKGRLDTHALTTVWGGADTTGLKVSWETAAEWSPAVAVLAELG